MKYEIEILNKLVDIYDRRLSNSSKFTTKVSIKLTKEKYPSYFQDTIGYDKAINNLVENDFIDIKKMKHDNVIESISLNINKIEEILRILNRKSKINFRNSLFLELDKYDDKPLLLFKERLKERINSNKPIKQYLDVNYIDAIKAVHFIENLEDDKFERDLSNYIFNDSKRLSAIKSNILAIYNESSDDFLRQKGVLQIPTYLFLKGNGIILVNNQEIDLALINDSIGICLTDNVRIEFKSVRKVTTIENLTTYYDYADDGIIIYLGGFATKSQIKVLKKLEGKIDKLYHFGDIDYGGFTILNNLMENLPFEVEGIYMNIETLKNNFKYLQKYNSDEYKKKLKGLLENPRLEPYYSAINYLIDNNVWLEQESFFNK